MENEFNDMCEYIQTRILKWERELQDAHSKLEIGREFMALNHLNEARSMLAYWLLCKSRSETPEYCDP